MTEIKDGGWLKSGIPVAKDNSEWADIKFLHNCNGLSRELSFCEDYSKWYMSLPWYKKIFYKIRWRIRSYLWMRRKVKFPIIKNIGNMPSVDEIVSCNSFTDLTHKSNE